MRQVFCRTLVELAERDRRVVLLTGDLGFMVLEPFAERFPDRFFNVGVAEQNMVGLATGLAEAGFIPFVYSIVTFASLRAYEFIRNGPILHRFPVRVVGVGGGFEYGTAGTTHHGLEDIGVMRIQPGLTVLVPADPLQARHALLATWDRPEPIYYRLSKDDKLVMPGLDGRFALGRVEIVAEGQDLLVITMGPIATEAATAAHALAGQGVRTTVAVVSTISPPPVDQLATLCGRFPVVISVEAHYVVGGIGSLVAEIVAEQGIDCRLVRCGVRVTPDGRSGSQEYFYQLHGLSSDSLVKTALRALHKAAR